MRADRAAAIEGYGHPLAEGLAIEARGAQPPARLSAVAL